MYQSYKALIESEEEAFVKKLSTSIPDQQILDIISIKAQRPNKLFVCSTGVWLPVKG